MVDLILRNFAQYFPEVNTALGAGILIFARLLGFIRYAPVFNRKEIPGMIKLSFILIFTILLVTILKPKMPQASTSLILAIILNFIFGALLGWMSYCIMQAVESGGDMINAQMGLSSAQVLDPTTQGMTSLMGKYFAYLGLLIFIHIGGIYWLLNAFIRSFAVFPMYTNSLPLQKVFNLDYIVIVTSNILYMGLQIASPVLLATLGQDIILGVISKTAPQINVFQLSFLFKPVFGVAILLWIMPMLIDVIDQYFNSFASIF